MSRKVSAQFDAALDVTRRLMLPGERLRQQELADICGVSRQLIQKIEGQALRKLRAKHAERLKEEFPA